MNQVINKHNIALFLALLFHACGLIGILFTSYRFWFIQNTGMNLLLMAGLLVMTQKEKNGHFFLFLVICFFTGMLAEIIGVNYGYLFGRYSYGKILSIQLFGVPLIIGLNWFVIVFCSGSIMYQLQTWVTNKYDQTEIPLSGFIRSLSIIFDSATLAVFFDYIMEPVAVKLGLWSWTSNMVPFYNYVCWFIISAFLMLFFQLFQFNKQNHFAIHLFIIQLLFFLALRIYL